MGLCESYGAANVSYSDMAWKKNMLSEKIPLEPPELAVSGESRYLTPLWIFGNGVRQEGIPQYDLTQSSITGFEPRAGYIDLHNQIIQKKIKAALKLLTFREQHVLVQIWLPHVAGKRLQLTTKDQLYGLGVLEEQLYLYRKESERNIYAVDKDHEGEVSPPARVYMQGLPEWSSDLTNYVPTQFPQQEYAIQCNLHGYLALPVFDSYTRLCVAVIELLGSLKYTSFAYEVQKFQKALKTENLTCLRVCPSPASSVVNDRRQNELEKIFSIMKDVCDIHRVPLAQTWTVSPLCSVASHEQTLKMSCNSFDTRCLGKACMSTADLPFYVQDLCLWPFREACKERHLDKSCGISGRALLSHGACFCKDVSILSEDEYPLAHNARISGLTSCFAICLHSVESNDDYVLEFFIPFRGDGRYMLNLVQTLKRNIDIDSGFVLGDESPMKEVVGPHMAISANMEPDIIQISSYLTDTSTDLEDKSQQTHSVNVSDECSSTNVSNKKKRKRGLDTRPSVTKKVSVKASYGEDIKEFRFPLSLGLLKLKNKVAKKFRLKSEMICLKYWDEENDYILFSGEDDLQFALVASPSKNIINLICELSDETVTVY